MVAAALIISIAALLSSALCALAVMELIASRPASASEPREDSIEEFEMSAEVVGTAASSHGLPDRIDDTDKHVVLVVSPMCARCGAIAASLSEKMPDGLTVVVTASAPARMRAWSTEHGLKEADLVFDDDMSIVNSLGISSSPTSVGFGGGKVLFAANVGGPQAVDELLQQRLTEIAEIPE